MNFTTKHIVSITFAVVVGTAGLGFSALSNTPSSCAQGFTQVKEGADLYRCEMPVSFREVCASGYEASPTVSMEKAGASGFKIIYRCNKKPL